MPLFHAATAPLPGADLGPLTPELVTHLLAPLVTEARRARIERVLRRRLASLTVVLENLYDPHNGAAVLRTCEALGLLHVHVVETAAAYHFSRKVSLSAHKWLSVYRHASAADGLAYLRRAGFACWAAVPPPRDRQAIAASTGAPPVTGPLALVFGNEHAGLSAAALALCDGRFSIPLAGFTQSLNLSVSAAIALHEAATRRRALLGDQPELPTAALARLRAGYYARSTPHAVTVIMQHLRR